jgi:hypothetical protein
VAGVAPEPHPGLGFELLSLWQVPIHFLFDQVPPARQLQQVLR